MDPEGSVTVVNLQYGYGSLLKKGVTTVGFSAFDGEARQSLIDNGVILKKGAEPSVDLEPEYIAIDQSERFAYVALQEANAIAVLDLDSLEFKNIYGLGFKDFSRQGNELDLVKDGKINIVNQNVQGIYMPDGIALYESNGETYLLTANEGDARDWPGYTNEKKIKIEGKTVTSYDTSKQDGLFQEGSTYIFGGRSFSIFNVKENGIFLSYDSGSDFERITAQEFPAQFNCSNNNINMDDRSGKKGPEPESVTVGTVDDRTYAFIALERIGGIMVYDITDLAEVSYVSYINTRDYSTGIAGDVAPEGLCFVNEKDSVTGKPLLIAANEVSGTVSVYSLDF